MAASFLIDFEMLTAFELQPGKQECDYWLTGTPLKDTSAGRAEIAAPEFGWNRGFI